MLITPKHSQVLVQSTGKPSKVPLVGIPSIDNDHLNMVYLLDCLDDKNYDKIKYADVISVFIEYLDKHCEEEELLMERINYPGIKFHKIEHESLRNLIKVYLKPELKSNVIEECKHSFNFHIKCHDMPLAKYMKSLGIYNL